MTTRYRHKHLTVDTVSTNAEAFGLTDERGRQVGIKTWVYQITTELLTQDDGKCAWIYPFPDTMHYTAYALPTRDGQNYGASNIGKAFLTLEEAHRETDRRTKGLRQRYEKKYG